MRIPPRSSLADPGRRSTGALTELAVTAPDGVWRLAEPAHFVAGSRAITINQFDVRNGARELALHGTMRIAGPQNVTSRARDLDLGLIQPLLQPNQHPAGTIAADIAITGTAAAPIIRANLTGNSLAMNQQRIGDLNVRANYDPGAADVNAALYQDRTHQMTLTRHRSAHARLGARLSCPSWQRRRLAALFRRTAARLAWPRWRRHAPSRMPPASSPSIWRSAGRRFIRPPTAPSHCDNLGGAGDSARPEDRSFLRPYADHAGAIHARTNGDQRRATARSPATVTSHSPITRPGRSISTSRLISFPRFIPSNIRRRLAARCISAEPPRLPMSPAASKCSRPRFIPISPFLPPLNTAATTTIVVIRPGEEMPASASGESAANDRMTHRACCRCLRRIPACSISSRSTSRSSFIAIPGFAIPTLRSNWPGISRRSSSAADRSRWSARSIRYAAGSPSTARLSPWSRARFSSPAATKSIRH